MLKKQMLKLISDFTGNDIRELELFSEEKAYIEKYQLLNGDIRIIEKDSSSRFEDAYIERGDKESEEFISEENYEFLRHPLDYLKKNIREFLYLESKWFELIGVDAISLEVDQVFGTYDVMLGLRLQKKLHNNLHEALKSNLEGDESNFDLMFIQEDGLWNLNFDLNSVNGFEEDMTLEDAFRLIYQFLFDLVDQVENSKHV